MEEASAKQSAVERVENTPFKAASVKCLAICLSHIYKEAEAMLMLSEKRLRIMERKTVSKLSKFMKVYFNWKTFALKW